MVRPPNILLLVVDCARSDKWLGTGRPVRTPNVDRLAGEGVALATAITEKSCTTPCFSSLLTGEYSPKHGVHLVWGYRLPERVPMLTDAFSRHGYHTYAEFTGPLLPEMGLARGFEEYRYRAPCDHLHTAWGDAFVERLRTGGYRAPWLIVLHVWELHPHRYVGPQFRDPSYGRDEYERAISSLDDQLGRIFAAAGDEAVIAFTGDHGEKTRFEQYRPGTAVEYARRLLRVDAAEGLAPFEVAGWAGPSVLQQMYGRCAPLMREVRLRPTPPATGGDSTAAGRKPFDFGFWARVRDRLRLLRLTPLVYLHDLLALGVPLKLTRMLTRRGLLDPARSQPRVARFAATLGNERLLDMHMRMWINSYKRNYEEGHMVHVYDFLTRVPLIVRCPARLPAGFHSARLIRQPDILPTLAVLAGIQPDSLGPIAGRDVSPLWTRAADWSPAPAFLSVSGTPADIEIRGIRTETHKFTYGPFNEELPLELYDLQADPDETRNCAAEQPELCTTLRAAAERFAAVESPPAEMPLPAGDQRRVEDHLRRLEYL